MAVLLLTVGEEEDWQWFAIDAAGCSSFFSVFSFSLSSIITSPSLCFSVLFLFFSGYGGAASDSVEAAGDGSRRGTVTAAAVLLLPCAEIPTFIFLSYFPLFFSIWFLSIISSSSLFFCTSQGFFPPLFCSFLMVFIGVGGARSTLPLSHHGIWGARPSYPALVPSKVANGEPLAGRDSPGIFIMRGCGLRWVLSFDSAWVSGGRERARQEETKEKNKKFLFPCCPFRGRRRRRRVPLKTTLFCVSLIFCVWGSKNR